MSPEAPRPGWYPDPSDKNRLRFWQGDKWSDKTKPLKEAGKDLVVSSEKSTLSSGKQSGPSFLSKIKAQSRKESGLVFLGVSGVIILALGVGFLGSMKKDEPPVEDAATAASLVENKKKIKPEAQKKPVKKPKSKKKPKRIKKAKPKNITQPAIAEEYTPPEVSYSAPASPSASKRKPSGAAKPGAKKPGGSNPGGSKPGGSKPGGSKPGGSGGSGSSGGSGGPGGSGGSGGSDGGSGGSDGGSGDGEDTAPVDLE